jgi:hypothetical protein
MKLGIGSSALFSALIALAVASIIFLSEAGRESLVDCEISRGPCTRAVAETGLTAVLEIAPKPVKEMKGLFFRIELKEGQIPVTDGDVVLSLSMPGMRMPENRVKLRHKGEGRYEGEGVIVKCPRGGRLWRAEAQITRSLSGQRQDRFMPNEMNGLSFPQAERACLSGRQAGNPSYSERLRIPKHRAQAGRSDKLSGTYAAMHSVSFVFRVEKS